MKMAKKLIITVTAGVVATTVAVGGIFAWFTSTADTGFSEFKTATVELVSRGTGSLTYSFYPEHEDTWEAQRLLEDNVVNYSTIPPGLKTNAQQAFSDWWEDYSGSFKFDAEADSAVSGDGRIHLLTQLEGREIVHNSIYNVSPGSILIHKYLAQNDSTIPVYMRVLKANVETTDYPYFNGSTGLTLSEYQANIVQMVTVKAVTGYNYTQNAPIVEEIPLVDGGDGYFYCPKPIEPTWAVFNPENPSWGTNYTDGYNIELNYAAFFPGGANDNRLQKKYIMLLGGSTGGDWEGNENPNYGLELIQATNNAVRVAEGWREANVNFIPYVPTTP